MSDIITKISSRYSHLISSINGVTFSEFTDEELRNESDKLRNDAKSFAISNPDSHYKDNDYFLIRAFALVKESVYRKLDIVAYDEQLWAGLVLNDNSLVEMATGEGKTIAAVFTAFLNSLASDPVHIFTFNDYLAKRDASLMEPVYSLLGATVGFLNEGQTFSERKKAYSCSVTYMTVKECGFDYLREFLAEKPGDLLLPEFNFAIVDEADSILIDEARIPLVIAASTDEVHKTDLKMISEIVNNLVINVDYEIDEYGNNIFLTEDGIENVEKMLGIDNLYDEDNMDIIVSVNNALFAKELVKIDVDYIVKNNSIELVDEFTGRVAQKRHWPHGLHEAIEAKENLVPSKKGQILSQITLQNFIRMYPRLAGMTGTASAAAKEFNNTYNLLVHVIPTHNKMIREDHTDVIFTNRKSKIDAILYEVIKASKIGRPVLLGTASVEESEEISSLLEDNGLKCEVLNAKNDEMEAQLIALAGASNAITVSTNMAGRGIDIKLGGGNQADKEKVVSVGGLLVIGTNRHESSRVDNQLRGRAGRQGDPGDSKFFISIEDELFVKYNFNDLISTRILEESESVIVTDTKILREANRLQRIVEGLHYDIRDSLSKYTVMLQEQGEYIRRMRLKILHSKSDESLFFQSQFPDRYGRYSQKYSQSMVNDAEKQLCLRVINQSWADYLDNMSYVKDSIHILKMSGMDPLFEYNKVLFESFNELKSNIKDQISELLETIEIDENGVNLDQIGLPKPGSTWTYIVSNTADQLNLFPFLESLTKIAKKRWFE